MKINVDNYEIIINTNNNYCFNFNRYCNSHSLQYKHFYIWSCDDYKYDLHFNNYALTFFFSNNKLSEILKYDGNNKYNLTVKVKYNYNKNYIDYISALHSNYLLTNNYIFLYCNIKLFYKNLFCIYTKIYYVGFGLYADINIIKKVILCTFFRISNYL